MLAIAIMYYSVKNNKGPLLIIGGFLLGVSLQTHPSVLVIFPGILIWYLARRDIGLRLKRPWPYLTVFAVLLGYANMIAYNLVNKFASVKYISQKQTYAFIDNPSINTYLTSLFRAGRIIQGDERNNAKKSVSNRIVFVLYYYVCIMVNCRGNIHYCKETPGNAHCAASIFAACHALF